MSTDFAAILNTRADTVKAPTRLPPGKYLAQIGQFTTGESAKKKTPFVNIPFIIAQPIDVAPENEGAAATALADGPVTMDEDYYLTPKSLFRLVDLLEKHIGIVKEGKSIAQMLTEAPGQSVAVILDHSTEVDSEGRPYINIVRTTSP